MKGHLKKRLLFTFVLVAQIFVTAYASNEYVEIPRQVFNCIGGTVVIERQTLYFTEYRQPDVRFEVVDVNPIVEPKALYSKKLEKSLTTISNHDGIYSGHIEYADYIQMGNELYLSTNIHTITKPDELVEVINVFVHDGAELNDAGEVVLLKNIDYYHPGGKIPVPSIPIQSDITIVGKGNNVIGHYISLNIENANLISEDALNGCSLNIINSTICFRKSPFSNIANLSIYTEGNVVFKGIYDENEDYEDCLRYNQIPLHVSVNPNLDDMSNSNITFENVELMPDWFIIRPSTTMNFKDCRWFIPSGDAYERDHLILKGGKVNMDNCAFGNSESNKNITFSVESGDLKINRSESHNIIVKGKDANVEINSGMFHALTIQEGNVKVNSGHFPNGITIDGGSLEVNNGYFPGGITMDGGSLEVNGGKVALLDVNDEKCDITLNQGLFGGIKIPSDVNKSIWDMLGHGAGYYDRDGTYIPYRLGISRATTRPLIQSYRAPHTPSRSCSATTAQCLRQRSPPRRTRT